MSGRRAAQRRVSVRLGVLVLGLALLPFAAGCGLPLFTATETFSEVFETSDTPLIVVETFNGTIDISNGAVDEVVVEVNKHASGVDQRAAAERLRDVEVSLEQQGDEIRITVSRVGRSHGNAGASLIIAAPEKSRLDLNSSNGYVVSEGMTGGIDAHTSNAKIEVYEGGGPIKAESRNGPIRIEATDALVDAQTSNSRIRFEGSLADGENKLQTSNGRIDVTLPEDAQFRFQARTSNGSVRCEFPDVEESENRGRRKSGVVGDDPQCSLSLRTTNSSIRIMEAD